MDQKGSNTYGRDRKVDIEFHQSGGARYGRKSYTSREGPLRLKLVQTTGRDSDSSHFRISKALPSFTGCLWGLRLHYSRKDRTLPKGAWPHAGLPRQLTSHLASGFHHCPNNGRCDLSLFPWWMAAFLFPVGVGMAVPLINHQGLFGPSFGGV